MHLKSKQAGTRLLTSLDAYFDIAIMWQASQHMSKHQGRLLKQNRAVYLAGQAGNLAIWPNDKVGLGAVQVDVIGRDLVPILSSKCLRLCNPDMACTASCATLRLHQQLSHVSNAGIVKLG